MNKRIQPVFQLPRRFTGRGKWLILLLLVLLFALVATTAAQEDADPVIDPPVPDPILVERTVTPQGVDTVVTIFATKDSFISSNFPNTNYGDLETLKVGYDTSSENYGAMRMLLQFGLSGIPANSVVNNARLDIYQSGCSPANDVNMGLQAQYMKVSWNEYVVTWNNANYQGGDVLGVGQTNCASGWKSFDATQVVRQVISGARPNYGFIVTGHEGTSPPRNRTFSSRQRANYQPRLTIDYGVSCDTIPPNAYVVTLPQWSSSSFTVSWTGTDSAPAGCNPSGIAHYDVQYNINNSGWVDWQRSVTNTSATFSGASNGQNIQFRARALDNASNLQAWGNAQTQTQIDTIPPTAQVNPLLPVMIGTYIPVSWSGSDNVGGSGIASYDIQFQEDGGDWQNWRTGTTTTSGSLTGVRNGVTYGFRVRATDVAGNVQPWTDYAQTSTTVYTNPIAVVLPFDPPVLTDTAPMTGSFTVRWQGFTVQGVSISQYQVQYKFKTGPWIPLGPNQGYFPVSTTEYTFAIPPANGDGTYSFEARALTSAVDIPNEEFTNNPEAFIIVDLEPPYIQIQSSIPLIMNED